MSLDHNDPTHLNDPTGPSLILACGSLAQAVSQFATNHLRLANRADLSVTPDPLLQPFAEAQATTAAWLSGQPPIASQALGRMSVNPGELNEWLVNHDIDAAPFTSFGTRQAGLAMIAGLVPQLQISGKPRLMVADGRLYVAFTRPATYAQRLTGWNPKLFAQCTSIETADGLVLYLAMLRPNDAGPQNHDQLLHLAIKLLESRLRPDAPTNRPVVVPRLNLVQVDTLPSLSGLGIHKHFARPDQVYQLKQIAQYTLVRFLGQGQDELDVKTPTTRIEMGGKPYRSNRSFLVVATRDTALELAGYFRPHDSWVPW